MDDIISRTEDEESMIDDTDAQILSPPPPTKMRAPPVPSFTVRLQERSRNGLKTCDHCETSKPSVSSRKIACPVIPRLIVHLVTFTFAEALVFHTEHFKQHRHVPCDKYFDKRSHSVTTTSLFPKQSRGLYSDIENGNVISKSVKKLGRHQCVWFYAHNSNLEANEQQYFFVDARQVTQAWNTESWKVLSDFLRKVGLDQPEPVPVEEIVVDVAPQQRQPSPPVHQPSPPQRTAVLSMSTPQKAASPSMSTIGQQWRQSPVMPTQQWSQPFYATPSTTTPSTTQSYAYPQGCVIQMRFF